MEEVTIKRKEILEEAKAKYAEMAIAGFAEKPSIGTAQYYVPAESRIKDLARVIWENVNTGNTGCVRIWAREIIEQCNLIEAMRRGTDREKIT